MNTCQLLCNLAKELTSLASNPKPHAYSIFLASAPIFEVIGALHDDYDFSSEWGGPISPPRGWSSVRFSVAIHEHFPEEYKKYTWTPENSKQKQNARPDLEFNLYTGFRCGLLHQLASTKGIEIMQAADLRKPHYSGLVSHMEPGIRGDGRIVLPIHLEKLVSDISLASEEISDNWSTIIQNRKSEKLAMINNYLTV